MNTSSITRIIGYGLVGLTIMIGVVNGALNAIPPSPAPDGAQVEQPDYTPMLLAASDDWESRV